MKMIIILLLLVPCLCFAGTEIEIKEIKIGMSKEEYEKIIPPPAFFDKEGKPQKVKPSNFTIAEIRGKHEFSSTSAKYDDNEKLESFIFIFSPTDFPTMLEAVKEKYPKLTCRNSTVNNAFGAKFMDTNCTFKDKKSILQLHRYVDLETSTLSLSSHKITSSDSKKKKERSRDL